MCDRATRGIRCNVSPEDGEFSPCRRFLKTRKGLTRHIEPRRRIGAGKLVLNYRLPLNDAGTTVLSLSAGTDIGKDKVFFDAGEGGRVY